MHLTLQLDIQFIQLTDTKLNESQAPPKLWISPYFVFVFYFKVIHICHNCSATTRVAEPHAYLDFAELPWAQILNGLVYFQSNNSIYKAKHLLKKSVEKQGHCTVSNLHCPTLHLIVLGIPKIILEIKLLFITRQTTERKVTSVFLSNSACG